jgi:moderate conductance mechanosensitive channel
VCSGELLPQSGPEAVEPAPEPRVHGATGEFEQVCDLAGRVVEQVAENDHCTVLRPELRECDGELPGMRPGRPLGRRRLERLALPELAAERAGSRPVDCPVDDDAVQPGSERPAPVEAVECTHRCEERLLGDVLGRGGVADDEQGCTVRPPPVVAEQMLEGTLVPTLCRADPGALAPIRDGVLSRRFAAGRRISDREHLRRYGNESHVRRYGDTPGRGPSRRRVGGRAPASIASRGMVDWLLSHGTRIGVLLLLALLASWVARHVIPRAVKLTLARERVDQIEEAEAAIALEELAKRASTLATVLVRSIEVTAFALAGIIALGEAGFQLGPLIAGAGVVGLAIGFGAQSLVRDVLGGLFILLENQYTEGDVVNIAGIGGTVSAVNLRRTVLRDIDGIVHTIPNGEVGISSNLTRSFARVNLDVSVGYGEDLDRVRDVIDAVGAELSADPEWAEKILEPPAVLRVNALGESGIDIKVLGTVRPMKQWEVAGELRKRIKQAFDREGIEIPFPHRVVIVREEKSKQDG